MREEFAQIFLYCTRPGITPAHAGRILCNHLVTRNAWDHPRACGKNPNSETTNKGGIGSPPRMREEFHSSFIRFGSNGITPAHAGRIAFKSCIFADNQDHPRACGKNWPAPYLLLFSWGSPPRMREECLVLLQPILCFGITPAHAGRITE